MSLSPLTFEELARRLVRDLAKLIHSGATTERRLAGMVGISQPHLHNVLNGVRKLTPSVADQVLEVLGWSLLDLVETGEVLALVDRQQTNFVQERETPFSQFGVGTGLQFPGDKGGVMPIPSSWLARTTDALAVSAGEDPEMEGIIEPGDILLVDRSREARSNWHEDALYVVRVADESLARWVRFSPRGLYVISAATWAEPSKWALIATAASRRHEVIEAKIIALARPPGRKFQRPVQPSVSS